MFVGKEQILHIKQYDTHIKQQKKIVKSIGFNFL